MRHISIDTEIIYAAAPDTTGGVVTLQRGKVIEVITPGAVRLQLGEKSQAIATHSREPKPGTFHFPDEAAVAQPPTAAPESEEN